jgi:hypothetical protein
MNIGLAAVDLATELAAELACSELLSVGIPRQLPIHYEPS